MSNLAKAHIATQQQVDAAQDAVDLLKAQLDGDPVREAQVRLAAAQHDLQRLTALAQAHIIPQSDVDAAQSKVDLLKAELQAVQSAHAAQTNSVR